MYFFLQIFVIITMVKFGVTAQMIGVCPPSAGVHNFADKFNCSVFHTCVNGNGPTRRICANTLHFDPKSDGCNSTPCNHCYAYPQDEITFVPSISACSEYYVCVGHNELHHECSMGLYYNAEAKSCDSSANVICTSDNPALQEIPPSPEPPLSLEEYPEQYEFRCPIDLQNNTIEYYPHPYDCYWYYVCTDDGDMYLKSCLPGLAFDAYLRNCEIESKAVCFSKYKPKCNPNEITFEPHPYNCKYYFVCIDGKSILYQCAQNLLFDITIEQCDDEQKINCPVIKVKSEWYELN